MSSQPPLTPSAPPESEIECIMPNSFNIGAGRRMQLFLTDDLEYLAIDFAPSTADYMKALKRQLRFLPAPSSIYLSARQLLVVIKNMELLRTVRQKVCCGKHVDCSLELGDNVRFTASSQYRSFQFRRYWKPEGKDKYFPTKIGVSLKESEFLTFLAVLPAFAKNVCSFDGGDELVEACDKLIAESEVPDTLEGEDETVGAKKSADAVQVEKKKNGEAVGLTPPPTPSPASGRKRPALKRGRAVKRLNYDDDDDDDDVATQASIILLSDDEQEDSQFPLSRTPPPKMRRRN